MVQRVTLRVISGADRGRIYRELSTPITIGREEGNGVQLNDERISRYHVKIQEDNGNLVITDLESTNGTRINGHTCNLKILRYGDTITVGRTVLLVGSREQVADWFDGEGRPDSDDQLIHFLNPGPPDPLDSTGLKSPNSSNLSRRMVRLPRGLSPGQAAELRELLDYLHISMRIVTENTEIAEKEQQAKMGVHAWQHFLRTQSELSEMIREIEDPQGSDAQSYDTGTD